MAFRVANKFPIDTKPGVAVGVSIPFSNVAVFNSTYTTQEQLKSNLINFFMTEPGERYMNPTYGGGLKRILFEQLVTGTFDFVKELVQGKVLEYFPNVQIMDLQVYGNEDQNILKVELTYQVVNFGITDSINLTLQ